MSELDVCYECGEVIDDPETSDGDYCEECIALAEDTEGTMHDSLSDEPKEKHAPEDPNADLVGKTITLADRKFTVTATPSWSDGNYVLLSAPGEPGSGIIDVICRPAGLIRRHLQLAA